MGRKTNVMDLQRFVHFDSQLELYIPTLCMLCLKLCETHRSVLQRSTHHK